MKEIKAFIRPNKLNEIYGTLKQEGFCCVSIFQGEGTGKFTDPREKFPSLDFPYLHDKVVKMEMVIKDTFVDQVTEIIQQQGSTGKSGDGLIYITDVNEVIRVRDGQKGENILHH